MAHGPSLRVRGMAAIATAGLVLGLGCSWRGLAWQLGLGSFATDLRVVRAEERGPYVEATLDGHGLSLDVLAPADPACRFVLTPESRVDYVESGVGGQYEREGTRCIAAGGGMSLVGSRRPRATTLRETPIPRSQATFKVLHADAQGMLLRGRFPEAWRLGWSGQDDTVVAVPDTPACRSAAEGGVASLEYRAAKRQPLALVGRQGLCPIQALARPPGDDSEDGRASG